MMKMNVLRLAGVAALAALAGQAMGQASNSCATATLITPGTYNGTSVGSTRDGTASCGSAANSPDVWYRITSATRKELTVTTCAAASFDTVLALFDACGGNQLTCNDDACDLKSSVSAVIEAGQTIYIRVAGFNGATGTFTLTATLTDPPPPPSNGPDIIVGDLPNISRFAPVNGVQAYSVGTTSCNAGDAPVQWTSGNNQHPVIGQNMYRLKDGRFEQIGASWVKHGFASLNQNLCGTCVSPPGGGSQLGVNCSDPYDSNLNGSQGGLGPRSQINATTGAFPYPPGNPSIVDTTSRRIRVLSTDVANAGARYFVEGHYIAADDATWGNGLNNASWREVTIASTNSTPALTGTTRRQQAAIFAWREIDPSVTIVNADYVGSGETARFHVGAKVTDLGNGTWRYTYAVHNMNSDRSGASLSMPKASGVQATNPYFKDVITHPDEPYNGNDWIFNASGNTIGWSTDQTHAQNVNANALRWGMMYTYEFVANTPPETGAVTIGLFKPGASGDVNSVSVNLPIPSAAPCRADFDGDGFVDFFDFDAFAECFEGGVCPPGKNADFDGDGFVDFFDFDAFVSIFEVGC